MHLYEAYVKPHALLALLVLTLLLVVASFAHPWASEGMQAGIMSQDGKQPLKPITLPFLAPDRNAAFDKAVYSVVFDYVSGDPTHFLFNVDDCWDVATINGQPIKPQHIDSIRGGYLQYSIKCNANDSSKLDLGSYLVEGANVFSVSATNSEGQYAFNFERQPDWLQMAALVSLVASVGAFVWKAGYRTATFFAVALLYYLFWFYYRPTFTYTNDVDGHMAYIRHMASQWTNPYGYWKKEHWHPPTYYFFAGMVHRFFGHLFLDPMTAVRILSIPIYMLYCWFGIRTMQQAIGKKTGLYYLAVLLMLFWPYSILLAARISNDVPLYTCWAGTFYCLMRWYHDPKPAHLRNTFVMLGITFSIKTTAITTAGVVGAIMLYALVRKRWHLKQLRDRRVIAGICILIVGMLVNAGRILYMYLLHNQSKVDMYLGGKGRYYFLDFQKAFTFDLKHYLDNPYHILFREPTFFNNITKTMMFSEMTFRHAQLAQVMNVALLLFIAGAFLFTVISLHARKRRFDDVAPYIIAIFVTLAAIMAFTYFRTYAVCQDFRFGYPSLIPLFALYVMGLDAMRGMRSVRVFFWLGIGLAIFIPIGGVIHFLGHYWA